MQTNQITSYLDQYAFKASLIPPPQSSDQQQYHRSLTNDIFVRMCSEITGYIPKDYTFYVTWKLAGGKGDLLHAIKVATIIRKHFPENKVQFICKQDDSTDKFIRDHGFQETPIRPENITQLNDTSPCCVLEVATPEIDRVRSDIAELMTMRKVHHIRIDEYNGWRYRDASNLGKGTFSSGIGIVDQKKTFPIGIHYEPELNHSPKSLNELENAELATQIGKSLSKGNSKLYFAYFSLDRDSFYLDRFIETIIKSEEQNSNNLSFVVICPEIDKLALENCIRSFASDITKRIGNAGIKKMKFSKLHDPVQVTFALAQTGKTVEINFVKSVSHRDVLQLMRISERPVLVSGDQSWAEAVSMDKIAFYQKQSWKKDLTKQMKQIGKVVTGPNSALSQFLGLVFKEGKGKRDELFVQPLAACLNDPSFGREVTAYNSAIGTHFDATSWILGRIAGGYLPSLIARFLFTPVLNHSTPEAYLTELYKTRIAPCNFMDQRLELIRKAVASKCPRIEAV